MSRFRRDEKHPTRSLLPARRGVGPLLQRDYWALIDRCHLTPAELIDLISSRFEAFPPPEVVHFVRRGPRGQPLVPGDEFDVHIAAAGLFTVRVLHVDRQSFTLGTVEGHPEAGRITFGAYRNPAGDVVFHIRSRARSRTRFHYAGFKALGDAMQTTCWTGFVNTVAWAAGEGVVDFVHADTATLLLDEDEHDAAHTPTYSAQGG